MIITFWIMKTKWNKILLEISNDISESKCKIFAFIKNRLQHIINGWFIKWVSRGGKYILIKFIIFVFPTNVSGAQIHISERCIGQMKKKTVLPKRRRWFWFLYDPWFFFNTVWNFITQKLGNKSFKYRALRGTNMTLTPKLR